MLDIVKSGSDTMFSESILSTYCIDPKLTAQVYSRAATTVHHPVAYPH